MNSEAKEQHVNPTREKNFKCSELGCLSTFSKRLKLINHLRKHKGERPFVCDVSGCGKSYTNSSHLRRHVKVSHEEEVAEAVTCDVCKKDFSNTWNLRKHVARVHDPLKLPFSCSYCGEKFKKRHFLQEHAYQHTGLAPFSCDKCECKFTMRKDLHKHRVRTHKTYVCSCGKTFPKWSLLIEHKKASSCSVFVCNICKKKFKSRGSLTQHQMVHADEDEKEVYKCTYENCEKFYFYKRNLTYHVNVAHEGLKNVCPHTGCEKVLCTKQKLKEHVQKIHSEDRKVERKVQKSERKVRKDKGIMRTDIALQLIGLESSVTL